MPGLVLVKMFPGMNTRQMKQAMKRMGIAQQDVPANEVIIKSDDREIVISNPQVSKINMMGQETYQVTGDIEEREVDSAPEVSSEDIQTVIDQTGVSEAKAEEALKQTKGDLAEAILKLKGE